MGWVEWIFMERLQPFLRDGKKDQNEDHETSIVWRQGMWRVIWGNSKLYQRTMPRYILTSFSGCLNVSNFNILVIYIKLVKTFQRTVNGANGESGHLRAHAEHARIKEIEQWLKMVNSEERSARMKSVERHVHAIHFAAQDMVTNVTCPLNTRMSLIKTASGIVKSLMTITAGVPQGKIAMAMGSSGIGATMTVLFQVSTY